MIILSEHTGYSLKKPLLLEEKEKLLLDKKNYQRFFNQNKEDNQLCYSIKYDENIDDYQFNSSFRIGVDWVIPNSVSIQVKPKLNTDEIEIDFLSMLFEALKETENLQHLEGLCEIDFNAPRITIAQQQDVLTPLLVIQFLSILQSIVKKGLKKSYYKVTKSLNGTVKGKINIAHTVKQHHNRKQLHFANCTYDEFGLNTTENKVLKKALLFSQQLLDNFPFLKNKYVHLINYLLVPFESVSNDVTVNDIKYRRSNRFYKEYDIALNLAVQILKNNDYNITKTSKKTNEIFPFWLDMSKLFELYIFKKLKDEFKTKGEVSYHKKYHRLEPDFILKSKDNFYKLVIDAKYKPRYKKHNILHKDAAQVSGYTRLKSIRKELGYSENEIVKALIIFTSNDSNHNDINKFKILEYEDKRYEKLFKYSVKLPIIVEK